MVDCFYITEDTKLPKASTVFIINNLFLYFYFGFKLSYKSMMGKCPNNEKGDNLMFKEETTDGKR